MNIGGCKKIPNGIVCMATWGRLHLRNRYIWFDFHEYGGPTFYYDKDMKLEYVFIEPIDKDPIWEPFEKWFEKYKIFKEKQRKKLYKDYLLLVYISGKSVVSHYCKNPTMFAKASATLIFKSFEMEKDRFGIAHSTIVTSEHLDIIVKGLFEKEKVNG